MVTKGLQMQYNHTFRKVWPWDPVNTDTDRDCVYVMDHLPEKEIDYGFSRQQLQREHYGQNCWLENSKGKTAWIFESYLHIQVPGPVLFVNETISHIKDIPTNTPSDKKYKFSAWLNKPRHHRVLVSSWINENFTQDFEYTSQFNAEEDGMSAHELFVDDWHPGLPKRWQDSSPRSSSVFDIVTEPNFFELGHHYSEKTEHCILDYCIPILHGYGACAAMKKLGFDMFEDIVDYSSQYIVDPYARTQKLMDDNKQVLQNAYDVYTVDVRQRLAENHRLLVRLNSYLHLLNSEEDIAFFRELMYNTNNKELRQNLRQIYETNGIAR